MSDPECDHCTRARAGIWAGYRANCNGCSARAVARSLTDFEAVRTRSAADLRELVERVLPGMPSDAAMKMVWAWWKSDKETK